MNSKQVRDLMVPLSEYATVSEDVTLGEAVHQLVLGHHQSPLVTEADRVVGILRLADVF